MKTMGNGTFMVEYEQTQYIFPLTGYELSGHMVFDRGQIRPAGKMY